jgi:hypothetical protein
VAREVIRKFYWSLAAAVAPPIMLVPKFPVTPVDSTGRRNTRSRVKCRNFKPKFARETEFEAKDCSVQVKLNTALEIDPSRKALGD